MRLNLLRSGGTKRYTEDGKAVWYVVDEDAPLAEKYDAIFDGDIVQCARFIQIAEAPAFAALTPKARFVIARNGALDRPTPVV